MIDAAGIAAPNEVYLNQVAQGDFAADGAEHDFFYDFSVGELMNFEVGWPQHAKPGNVYVEAYLITKQNTKTRMALCAGPVWDRRGRTFPQHDLEAPSVRGRFINQPFSSALIVPPNVRWKIKRLSALATMDAVGGNRVFAIYLYRAAGGAVVPVWESDFAMVANDMIQYAWAIGLSTNVGIGGYVNGTSRTYSIDELDMVAGDELTVYQSGFDAGDSLSTYADIEEFIEP